MTNWCRRVCPLAYPESEGQGIHDNISDKNSSNDKVRSLRGVCHSLHGKVLTCLIFSLEAAPFRRNVCCYPHSSAWKPGWGKLSSWGSLGSELEWGCGRKLPGVWSLAAHSEAHGNTLPLCGCSGCLGLVCSYRELGWDANLIQFLVEH